MQGRSRAAACSELRGCGPAGRWLTLNRNTVLLDVYVLYGITFDKDNSCKESKERKREK